MEPMSSATMLTPHSMKNMDSTTSSGVVGSMSPAKQQHGARLEGRGQHHMYKQQARKPSKTFWHSSGSATMLTPHSMKPWTAPPPAALWVACHLQYNSMVLGWKVGSSTTCHQQQARRP
jgi:hypothetical protein